MQYPHLCQSRRYHMTSHRLFFSPPTNQTNRLHHTSLRFMYVSFHLREDGRFTTAFIFLLSGFAVELHPLLKLSLILCLLSVFTVNHLYWIFHSPYWITKLYKGFSILVANQNQASVFIKSALASKVLSSVIELLSLMASCHIYFLIISRAEFTTLII